MVDQFPNGAFISKEAIATWIEHFDQEEFRDKESCMRRRELFVKQYIFCSRIPGSNECLEREFVEADPKLGTLWEHQTAIRWCHDPEINEISLNGFHVAI